MLLHPFQSAGVRCVFVVVECDVMGQHYWHQNNKCDLLFVLAPLVHTETSLVMVTNYESSCVIDFSCRELKINLDFPKML